MENNYDNEFLEKIWKDANFKISKKPILSGETIKKNSIRKINSDGKVIAYCKVCNSELYISINYNGEFPLCKLHRNPNDR